MKDLFRLDGRVALVTGAAHGIGKATAEVLARQGAAVAVADIDAAAAADVAKALGSPAASFATDVGSVAQCRALIDTVAKHFGRIDILVNNAGICPTVLFENATEADWDRIMNVNARSQYFLMQAVRPLMKRQGGGRIVNVASVSGRVGSLNLASIYSGTKGAIAMFSKSVAREVAADGILINCVAPGLIATEILANLPADRVASIAAASPLGRLGRPDEVAAMIAFLASDACSYCTGAMFDINGGWMML